MRLWPALAGSFRASKQNAQLCACGRTGCVHVTDDAFLLDPSECLAAKAPATKCKFCSPLSSSTTAPDRRRGDTQKCRPHTSCTGSWLTSLPQRNYCMRCDVTRGHVMYTVTHLYAYEDSTISTIDKRRTRAHLELLQTRTSGPFIGAQ